MIKEGKNKLVYNLFIITVFFNIWFPKAGIKLQGIPLTLGNVFFIITFLWWLMTTLKKGKITVCSSTKIMLVGILYFILKYAIIIFSKSNISSYVTYMIPLIIYPFMLFVTRDLVKENKELKSKVFRVVYYGFYFLCFYSLLQFFVGIGNCDIPGLTVNLTDYVQMGPQWFMNKANGIEVANSKIVSTYQNGNLFGVNLLFIYPLVFNYLKEKNKEKSLYFSLFLFIICTFLTLSRTCWLGIVVFVFLGIILEREKNKTSLLRKVVIIFLCIISLICVFKFIPSVSDRFFGTDKSDWISMSGRTEGLFTLISSINSNKNILTWILVWLIGPNGIVAYKGLAFEMLPTALLAQTGIIGIFLLYSFYGSVLKNMKLNDYIKKGVHLSIIIWLIIGCIECGYWLPPTALNIFILIGLAKADE